MGAGASVLPSDSSSDAQGVVDLDTFALVQHEYRRLSCREVIGDDDAPPAELPTDEEVFVHLKTVVVQRYEHKQQQQLSARGEDDTVPPSRAEDRDDGPSQADIKDSEGELRAAVGTEPVVVADAKEAHAQATQADESEEDDEAVRMLQRPLTAETLRALAAAIPDDAMPDDLPLTSSFHSVVSSSSGSHGRSSGLSSMTLASMSSASSNSGSGSTFDLTQNLTPVFTTDVLTDPTTLKMLSGFADREQIARGGDYIKFWVEIDALAQLPSHAYTHRRLRKIYDKFLSPEAPSPVCVTSHMLVEIETALQSESISTGIYFDAQQICLTALEQSVYPRFRENRLFKKMIEFCAPPQGPTVRHVHEPDTEDYTLAAILTHPAKLRFLKTYCMEALALENLLFYLEVEDCKRLPNLSFIVNKTRKVYDRYCTPTSKSFLVLPDAVFVDLHAAAAAAQPLLPKLFYEAQRVVFQRISDEIWKGFCRTSEYLEYSRKLRPERRTLPLAPRTAVAKTSPEQREQLQQKLDALNEFQLIEAAMHYPVAKLIPQGLHDGAPSVSLAETMQGSGPVFTPAEQLAILLSDAFGKKYLKQFMHSRGVDHFLAFCHEIDDFKLLPGIEFLQHTAKKIYRKYILPTAKMQVDMSRAMRDEIGERLLTPSIDMFKRIAQRVRHGLLQDAMPRFVKSSYYSELKKLAKQFKETSVESDLKAIDVAAKKGTLELAHLDLLLQNQLSMKQLRLFLESQHCAENLMLYEEIEHFRRLPSYQIVLRSAKKMYDKYLNPHNTRNPVIPISEALRSRVVAQLDAASRTTFDEVERECGEFMRNVVVPDFLDSRIFMALVGTWAIVDDAYPREMLKGEFEMAFLRHRFHLLQDARGLSRHTSSRSPHQ